MSGIGTSTVVSLVSFAIATSVGLSQLLKWIQEYRDRLRVSRDAGTKAEAERDSIAIKGAEGVLLMMQEMLRVSQASEGKLQQEVAELRKRVRALEERNEQLEKLLKKEE